MTTPVRIIVVLLQSWQDVQADKLRAVLRAAGKKTPRVIDLGGF
jgi:hypothetical protein